MKKILSIALVLCMVLAFAVPSAFAADTVKIGMVTDVGGVNDKSFNQTSWEGLQALAAEDDTFEVAYLESKTDADYQTNINTFIDEEYDLIICVGYMLADATREAAEDNPDQLFAIIDDSSIDLPNVACLMFAQEQASCSGHGLRLHEPLRHWLHHRCSGSLPGCHGSAVQRQQLR